MPDEKPRHETEAPAELGFRKKWEEAVISVLTQLQDFICLLRSHKESIFRTLGVLSADGLAYAPAMAAICRRAFAEVGTILAATIAGARQILN